MLKGWFRDYRSIYDHWIYNEKREFSKFEAWHWIVGHANHKDSKVVLGASVIMVKRGDLLTSKKALSDKFMWSRSKLERFLNALESDCMVSQNSTYQYTLITVENYGKYQGDDTTNEHQTNIDRTSNEHQTNIDRTHIKNVKNKKNVNNDKETVIARETDDEGIPPSETWMSEEQFKNLQELRAKKQAALRDMGM